MDYRVIAVAVPHQDEYVYTKVSPEDYDTVLEASQRWRLSSSGYVIFVVRSEGKFKTTYLHKLIFGDSAKHANGDRLDNRRSNLIESPRGPPKSRKRKEPDRDSEEGFQIHTPRVVCADMHVYRGSDDILPTISGYAEIKYRNGEKFFSGDIQQGKPHGYGHLYEAEKHAQSCGTWSEGVMREGMVVTYKPVPDCICEIMHHCPLREVEKLEVVKGGCRLP